MKKLLKYSFVLLLLSACAMEPAKQQSESTQDDNSKKSLLDENTSTSPDNDIEGSVVVAPPTPSPAVVKDVSASEEKFKNAVGTTREDAVVQYGSEILAQKPDDIKTLNGFAQFYIKSGQTDLAKIFLNRITAKDPKNADANNSLGVIALKEGKEPDAQVFFKRAIQGNDSHAEANANLGNYYLKYMDYDKAAMFLQKAYDHDHRNIAVANNYAVALRGQGKYDDAMSIYKSIESKAKTQVLLNEAILLSQYKKDFKEAKDILNKIRFISSDPAIMKKVNILMTQIDQQKTVPQNKN